MQLRVVRIKALRKCWRIAVSWSCLLACLFCTTSALAASTAPQTPGDSRLATLANLGSTLQVNSANDFGVAISSRESWGKFAVKVMPSGDQVPPPAAVAPAALGSALNLNLHLAGISAPPVLNYSQPVIAPNALDLSLATTPASTGQERVSKRSLAPGNPLKCLSLGRFCNQLFDPAQLETSTRNLQNQQWTQALDSADGAFALNHIAASINLAKGPAGINQFCNQPGSSSITSADLMDLGNLSPSLALKFWQLAQVVNGSKLVPNQDGSGGERLSASVVVCKNLNSPYLFLNILDQWGDGGQNYETAVLAVDIGKALQQALITTPEPSLYLTLGGFLLLAVGAKRRMDRLASAILE